MKRKKDQHLVLQIKKRWRITYLLIVWFKLVQLRAIIMKMTGVKPWSLLLVGAHQTPHQHSGQARASRVPSSSMGYDDPLRSHNMVLIPRPDLRPSGLLVAHLQDYHDTDI